jgi:hypothetical protein
MVLAQEAEGTQQARRRVNAKVIVVACFIYR